MVPDKSLKDKLDKLMVSGYFDRAETNQNGACESEETQEEPAVVTEAAVTVEPPSEPGH